MPIAILYLAVRVSALNGFSHPQQRVTLSTFVLTLPSIAFFYFKQWLFPVHLSEFYDLPVSTSFNVSHVLIPMCGLLLIAAALFLVRRKLGSREVAFAAGWMILPLLPAFDFAVFPLGDIVHDRYFYVSSFGAALLLALALEKLAKGPVAFGLVPRRLLFVTLALLLVLSWDTANAASYWSDNYVLFQHAYQLAPLNANPRLNYAIELSERGQYDKALPILEQLLKDQPDNYLANYNLGRALYELGLMNAAEHFFQQTVKLSPEMSRAYLHLGLIDMKTQRGSEAVSNMRQAVALRPLEPSLHFALAVALAQQNDCKSARAEFGQTLSLEPGFPHAQEQMDKCGRGSSSSAGESKGTGAGTPSLAGVAADSTSP